MSQAKPPRFPSMWTETLDASGLPWRVEIRKKHCAIIVCDRIVTVVSRQRNLDKGRHDMANTLAAIRRAIVANKEASP